VMKVARKFVAGKRGVLQERPVGLALFWGTVTVVPLWLLWLQTESCLEALKGLRDIWRERACDGDNCGCVEAGQRLECRGC
jgi:hypothetical protein